MLGAICGDIIGSVYEWHNIKTKDFELFKGDCRYTDDSVMTIAIAKACIEYLKDKEAYEVEHNITIVPKGSFRNNCIKYMRHFGNEHIGAGYGGRFFDWLSTKNPQPYNSYGNGSAMRVSPCGWVAQSLKEAEELAEISAEVTHNHPEGIKGAKAIASAIWLLRNGKTKDEVLEYIKAKYYVIDFTLNDIRTDYKFDVTCQGSVPQAIEAFMESNSFEDAIKNAISIGGDSDTIGAITGSMAEAFYGIDEEIKNKALSFVTKDLMEVIEEFENIKV